MSSESYLGEFEHLVLLAVLQLGKEAYGGAIRDMIEDRAERSVSFGAVYSTLRRMERKGYVRSKESDAGGGEGGRARKFFEVTPPGKTMVVDSRRRLESMAKGLRLTGKRAR